MESKVLLDIRQALLQNLPLGGRALLYGSRARGDARVDFDWDVLIILDKEKLFPDDYDRVSYPLTKLGWDIGATINPVMYTPKWVTRSEKSWWNKPTKNTMIKSLGW